MYLYICTPGNICGGAHGKYMYSYIIPPMKEGFLCHFDTSPPVFSIFRDLTCVRDFHSFPSHTFHLPSRCDKDFESGCHRIPTSDRTLPTSTYNFTTRSRSTTHSRSRSIPHRYIFSFMVGLLQKNPHP